MSAELLALVIGMSANFLAILGAVCVVAYQLGGANKTLSDLDRKIGKLDETNGGGFARCTQHSEQISELERRQQDLHEQWAALRTRLEQIDKE